MSEELKPCPFCGKYARVEKYNSGYQVRCYSCGARGKYVVVRGANPLASRDEAIKAWNKRAGDAE